MTRAQISGSDGGATRYLGVGGISFLFYSTVTVLFRNFLFHTLPPPHTHIHLFFFSEPDLRMSLCSSGRSLNGDRLYVMRMMYDICHSFVVIHLL